MRASRKKHASSTWCSILAWREALQHGLIATWLHQKTSESTDIWGDRWISDRFDAKKITPTQDQDLSYVSNLLTKSGSWNVEPIRDRFLPIDAEAILRRPMARGEHDSWAGDPKFGVYTMKSAYKLMYRRMCDDVLTQKPSFLNDGMWKAVWKLEAPLNVRVFWWRVLRDFLQATYRSFGEGILNP